MTSGPQIHLVTGRGPGRDHVAKQCRDADGGHGPGARVEVGGAWLCERLRVRSLGIPLTRDIARVMGTVGELDFGEIYVNRGIGELPQGYHTGMKKSGLAGEDGKYGLENYLHKKTYYVNST